MVVADLSAVGVIKLRRGPVSWAARLGNGGEEASEKI